MKFEPEIIHVLCRAVSFSAISVATFPVFFFPAQVMMGMESISDIIESQSVGLKKVMNW